ncbi:MAG TPA: dihydrolipoyl dehydrogenase [Anaerolineae bacterium]|nr:dihydrolipoyl dehydrogenase [Anaerolineae bacterium]
MMPTDLIVIGGGPGGYITALRAAQLGAHVTLVEAEYLGGVCLNVGCIPTKALLASAEVYHVVSRSAEFGVRAAKPEADWPAMQARKADVVAKLVGGVRMLLGRAGVDVVEGHAHLSGPGTVAVDGAGGMQTWAAPRIVIATGSSPLTLPIAGGDLPGVLDSTGALALEALPASLLVVGGGAVGLEFATLFATLGSQVTVVEMLPRLAPLADADVGDTLRTALLLQGAKVHVSTKITAIEAGRGALRARLQGPQGEVIVEADKALLATGRRPNVAGLGLEAAGVRYDRRGIQVNEHMATSVPGIYAVGDVTGGSMLAHVAMHQGAVAAESSLGHKARMRYDAVPSCIFARPEAASVGLTEQAAREQGYDVRVGRFPFNGNGKAIAQGEVDGFIKVVAEARYGALLGLHIVGAHASDLVLEGALGLTLEMTLDELAATIHPHPSLGEALAEAGLAALGRPLHLPKS